MKVQKPFIVVQSMEDDQNQTRQKSKVMEVCVVVKNPPMISPCSNRIPALLVLPLVLQSS